MSPTEPLRWNVKEKQTAVTRAHTSLLPQGNVVLLVSDRPERQRGLQPDVRWRIQRHQVAGIGQSAW